MAWLLGRKGPQDLAKALEKYLGALAEEKDDVAASQQLVKLGSTMTECRKLIYGEGDGSPAAPAKAQQLAQLLVKDALFAKVFMRLASLNFEERKHTSQVCSYLMRHNGEAVAAAIVEHEPEFLRFVVQHYGVPALYIHHGALLRECSEHKQLWEIMMGRNKGELLQTLFELVQLDSFDTASDAMSTMRTVLITRKNEAAELLLAEYSTFEPLILQVLRSNKRASQRQLLRLMHSLFMDQSKAFYPVMQRFVQSVDNLKAIMSLFHAGSKAIQVAAFHIFWIFCANPNKPEPVLQLLARNKGKLVTFVASVKKADVPDAQLVQECDVALASLSTLPDITPAPSPAPSPHTSPSAVDLENTSASVVRMPVADHVEAKGQIDRADNNGLLQVPVAGGST